MTKMEATSLAQLIRIVDRFDLGMQSESHATH
jgi:hypothetical protein